MKEIFAGVSFRASQRCFSLQTFVEFADFCVCERIVHAFIVSELDHCNIILHWFPKSQLDQLCVIKYVVIVHRGIRQEMIFIRFSHDGVTLDDDRGVSTAIRLVFLRRRGRLLTCRYMQHVGSLLLVHFDRHHYSGCQMMFPHRSAVLLFDREYLGPVNFNSTFPIDEKVQTLYVIILAKQYF